ncbi:DUF4437 domain-containing protein [Neiella marina]|uniref:DUF4437 domain-containing protein n=1 Tax=Neiella holothuriorum TaxID=2870530 RepID=A0ABS7EKQ0_9GAMM|nr:DUF4437 domain-containing protein [Neiella holothuriorum]MBW8192933.1 DUF4437 domain-containing protein [Neiella holothuriorum]
MMKSTTLNAAVISATIFSATTLLTACAQHAETTESATLNTEPPAPHQQVPPASYQQVLADDVDWQKLNPARGDASPKAGTLWGDRNGTSATGFLFNPVDGFESPPHIHNVSYRGVVIRGEVHNDDPNAAQLWMPAGSFWTQPAGESHITAAKGANTLAYIEIDSGPYLVKPTAQAFDNGERPVNLEQSNLVWLTADKLEWVQLNGNNAAQVSYLWGSTEPNQYRGMLLKLPANFSGQILTNANEFRAVVIAGQLAYQTPLQAEDTSLTEGSYVSSSGAASHTLKSRSEQPVTLYVRTNGELTLVAN